MSRKPLGSLLPRDSLPLSTPYWPFLAWKEKETGDMRLRLINALYSLSRRHLLSTSLAAILDAHKDVWPEGEKSVTMYECLIGPTGGYENFHIENYYAYKTSNFKLRDTSFSDSRPQNGYRYYCRCQVRRILDNSTSAEAKIKPILIFLSTEEIDECPRLLETLNGN
jgi:hypothetical protein